jgi:MFS family permease
MPSAAPPAPAATVPEPENERLPADVLRTSMGRVVLAWGFGAAFVNLTNGAIYTAFALQIGANNTAFGIMAAAMPLMSFLQVLAAWFLERHRRRKRQLLVAGVIGRALWMVVPLLPVLNEWFPSVVPKSAVLPGIITAIVLSSVFQAFVSPAFFSWMTDLAPPRVRSAFFARRFQVGTIVALAASFAGGLIADNFPDLTIYCFILFLAACAGMVDIVMFFGVRDPRSRPPAVEEAMDDLAQSVPSPLAAIREPLRDPSVRRFMRFVCLLFCGYGLYGPFVWKHSLEYLNLTKTETGLIVTAAPMIAMASTSRFWGRLTRKYGNRPVMRLGSLGLMYIPLGMLLIQPDPNLLSKVLVAALFFLSGVLFVAIDLSNVNLITALAPQIPRSTMTALYSIAAGCSFALCSVFAGKLADWLGSWHIEVFGLSFVNFHVLFALSLVVRAINAAFFAPRLHEPEARSARFMAGEVVPQIWENISGRIPRPFSRGEG